MRFLIKVMRKPRTDTSENTRTRITTTCMLLLQIFVRHTLHAKYDTSIMSLHLHHNLYLCFHKLTQLISGRASHLLTHLSLTPNLPPPSLGGYIVSLIITKTLQVRCDANCKED